MARYKKQFDESIVVSAKISIDDYNFLKPIIENENFSALLRALIKDFIAWKKGIKERRFNE